MTRRTHAAGFCLRCGREGAPSRAVWWGWETPDDDPEGVAVEDRFCVCVNAIVVERLDMDAAEALREREYRIAVLSVARR